MGAAILKWCRFRFLLFTYQLYYKFSKNIPHLLIMGASVWNMLDFTSGDSHFVMLLNLHNCTIIFTILPSCYAINSILRIAHRIFCFLNILWIMIIDILMLFILLSFWIIFYKKRSGLRLRRKKLLTINCTFSVVWKIKI